MFNRVYYRFIISKTDESPIERSRNVFKNFINAYENAGGVDFMGLPIKMTFDYGKMNNKAIYIHVNCKYPYELCLDDIDYNIENAILTGIDIMDIINDLDHTIGKKLSKENDLVAVLDMVIINNVNYSFMINEYI